MRSAIDSSAAMRPARGNNACRTELVCTSLGVKSHEVSAMTAPTFGTVVKRMARASLTYRDRDLRVELLELLADVFVRLQERLDRARSCQEARACTRLGNEPAPR